MSKYANIYLLYSCNICIERSSMRLLGASTDITDLYMIIEIKITQCEMEYQNESSFYGAKLFVEDVKAGNLNLSLLNFGVIETMENIACS